jgi:hypothetical protein
VAGRASIQGDCGGTAQARGRARPHRCLGEDAACREGRQQVASKAELEHRIEATVELLRVDSKGVTARKLIEAVLAILDPQPTA